MSDDARVVDTPFGPGVSLYPSSGIVFVGPERALMIAVWDRAIKDARWLEAIEALPRSTWKRQQHDEYRRLTSGVVDPRTWLEEQAQLRAS